MAGRSANISVKITGESDFGQARREAKAEIDKIERDAESVELKLSPEVDTAEVRKAIDLAKTLDGLTAQLDVNADISEIVEAEKLARSLRGFQARVDLSVAGREELKDALDLSEQFDRIRKVKLEVQGRQDLERAAELADQLEKRRTVGVDVDLGDISRAGDKLEAELDSAGEGGANAIADHLGEIDFESIGASGLDQLTGALATAGPWGAVAASVGVVFADDFLQGFQGEFGRSRSDLVRSLRTGLSGRDLAEVGEAAGNIYITGLSGELTRGELKDAVAQVRSELGSVDDDLDLERVTGQALALEQVFGTDLAESIAAVDKLVSLKLVPNSEAGFNALFALGQQTGDQFGEATEVATEFSSALAALSIEGPQGLFLIGQAIEKGIFPQVDQAGEVFEEFNETIRTGGAADALEIIGLKASDMQAALARGDGAEAMALIADKLLALPDPAQRAAAAAEIFGGNMALVADPDIALELFSQADGMRDVGDAATDASKQLADSRTNLEGFKKGASDAGSALADTLDKGLGVVSEGLVDFVDKMTGGAIATEDFVGGAETLSTAAREGGPQLEDMADGADTLAGSLDQATQSADDLEAQLRGMFDFSADQLFRDIAGGVDDLAASFEDGGKKAIDMTGAIDIGTDAGRKLQEQFEGLNGTLVDAEVAFANQEISAEQLAAVHANLETEFRAAASAAGLTSQQVDVLTAKYFAVPTQVTTNLNAVDNATQVVKNLQAELSKLKDKTITVTTRNAIIAATASSTQVRERARGGWTEGLTLVGEEGPELIDVKGRAFVHTATETRQLMSNRGGDLGGAPALAGAVTGGPRINIERLVVDKGVDLWQQLDLAELVYGHR